jgi:hypothetical protein
MDAQTFATFNDNLVIHMHNRTERMQYKEKYLMFITNFAVHYSLTFYKIWYVTMSIWFL